MAESEESMSSYSCLGRCLLLGVFTWLCAGCADFPLPWLDTAPQSAGYGQKVRFGVGQPIHFPDFTLTYTGERHVTSEIYPRGFTYQDFAVTQGEEESRVSWSSGTGVIDPASFDVNGVRYRLELAYSDEVGRLAENQLVLWQEGPSLAPATTPQPQSSVFTLDEPFVLRWMETATLAAEPLTITFAAVSSDSRCPVTEGGITMVCVMRGEAQVILSVHHHDGNAHSVILSTDVEKAEANRAMVDGFQIELLDLQPLPRTDRPRPNRADYVATLQVNQIDVAALLNPAIHSDTIGISCKSSSCKHE
jgi:hypothetical protein